MLIPFHEYHNTYFRNSPYNNTKRKIVLETLDNTIKSGFVEKIVSSKQYKLFVFVDNITSKNKLGLIMYKKYKTNNKTVYYIPLMAISPQYRRNGFGHKLLNTLIYKLSHNVTSQNKTIFLQLHSIRSCEEFYQKFGFTKITPTEYVHNEPLEDYDSLFEYKIENNYLTHS